MDGLKASMGLSKSLFIARLRKRREKAGNKNAQHKDLSRMEKAAAEGRWDDVKELVLKACETSLIANEAPAMHQQKNTANKKSKMGSGSNISIETSLHMICRHHPPLEMIKFMFQEGRQGTTNGGAVASALMAAQMNTEGQTPLHIASMCGASPQVVQFLADQCKFAVEAQDNEGNTPLHLHIIHTSEVHNCDSGIKLMKQSLDRTCHSTDAPEDEDIPLPSMQQQKNKSNKNIVLVDGPNLRVVDILVNAASSPEMLLVENVDEISVVELAIMYEMDFKFVSKLQEMTRKHRRKMLQEMRQ